MTTSDETTPAVYRPGGTQWLAPVQLAASTLARAAADPATVRATVATLARLEPDDYLSFMLGYYRQGLERFGTAWGYLDLLTVLRAAAAMLQPRDYLEIGVRRGRSLAVVGEASPSCAMLGFDLWIENYAGMPNPGPGFVRTELEKVGHRGPVELVSGDSHETVPAALRGGRQFDLVTVDGDHSEEGARLDLRNVLPSVRVGGVLLMDDISHPLHPELARVWDEVVVQDGRFDTHAYGELGYGIAFAVRRS